MIHNILSACGPSIHCSGGVTRFSKKVSLTFHSQEDCYLEAKGIPKEWIKRAEKFDYLEGLLCQGIP